MPHLLISSIRKAIAMREAVMRTDRWRRRTTTNFAAEMGRLRTFADRNPYPSEQTLDAFFSGPLFNDLTAVAPGNKAGDALIKQLLNAYRHDLTPRPTPTAYRPSPAR